MSGLVLVYKLLIGHLKAGRFPLLHMLRLNLPLVFGDSFFEGIHEDWGLVDALESRRALGLPPLTHLGGISSLNHDCSAASGRASPPLK